MIIPPSVENIKPYFQTLLFKHFFLPEENEKDKALAKT